MDTQSWIQLGALVTAVVPLLTAALKRLLGSTRYNAVLPLLVGVLTTLGAAMAGGQVRTWADLLPVLLTGLAGGGIGSSARDVWVKTLLAAAPTDPTDRTDRSNRTAAAVVILALALLPLSGCFLSGASLADAVKELSRDNSSVCLSAWVGVGAGALVPAPTVPITGGWGYIVIGRTNEPHSKLDLTNSQCKIEHGTVVPSVTQVVEPAQ